MGTGRYKHRSSRIDIGDYAAYVGQGSPEWIADHGDKISFKEATVHFPGGQLEKEKYRG